MPLQSYAPCQLISSSHRGGQRAACGALRVVGPRASERLKAWFVVADETAQLTIGWGGAHHVDGCPLKAAARVAVNMVRSTPTDVDLIRFVCYDQRTLQAFRSALGQNK